MHYAPQQIPNGLAALILFVLALYGWSRRRTRLSLPFAGIMLLGAFWGACSTLELASEALATKILWNRLHFVSTTLGVVILFWIVLKSRGRARWLAPKRFFIFLIEPAAALVLALSGWGDWLFLSGISLSYAGPVPTLVYVAGPLYWVHVAYTYALLTCSFVPFASWARDSQPRFRSQSKHIVVAMVLPGPVNVLFHIGLSPLPGIDLTPAALVVTGAIASLAIFRFRLADIVPLASRLIVQTMEDLTLVVDAKDNLVDFNPSARVAIGMDPRRAAGRTLEELPPPWPDVFAPYAGVPSARDVVRVELPAGVRWYHLAVSALRDESGATVGRLFHLHDVTERKRVEDALRESEKNLRTSESKYRNLIEVAPEAISVVENQNIIFCNSRLLDMLGYTHEEMIGMEFRPLIHKDDLSRATERYVVRSTGKFIPKTVQRLVKKDGEIIWVDTIGQRIEWEGRPAVLYFSSDITEKKRLEELFAQAQKMEAIGRLAGGVAHDFNNMLQVILGFCSMMKSYPNDRNAILNDLRVIEDSAQRAASLTQQLLAFSRKQMVQPKVIDLGELVQQSKKMLGRVLGEDIALTVVLGEEASRVKADAAQIQQVIMNLALNARDAMPEGGTITISIDNVSLLEAMGHEIPAGDYVRLTVSDIGHGMDVSTMDHLFEPFFTTKGLGKGTGLGLSIVYGIVKQCEGYIKVESKICAGSTFTIHLPRVCEPTEDSKARAEEESHHGSASILLVEDEASVRKLVRMILEKGGYTVTEAESGEEAIKVCRAHPEGFDLLITDIVLTGMRGRKVADSVRHFFPRVQMIYMSGYSDNSDAPQQESVSFLKKPFSSTELLAQVKKTLAVEPNRSISST